MVAGGLGVSLLPKVAADAGVASGINVAVRAFTKPIVGRSIGLAWRSGSSRNDEVQLISTAVKEAMTLGATRMTD